MAAAAAAAPHPSVSLGARARARQRTASAARFQSPGTTTGFSAGGPRHPRLAHGRHPLLRDGWPQAGSASPPSPANAEATCPGSRLRPTPAPSTALRPRASTSLPRGPGRRCPARATARRPQITLALSARSRPRRPGREPWAPHPGPHAATGARVHTPTLHISRSTLSHTSTTPPHRHHLLAPLPSP